jgi:hypothetical protein
MYRSHRIDGMILCLLLTAILIAGGCSMGEKGEKPRGTGSQTKASSSESGKKGHEKDEESAGWWCKEHGVPEHLCSQCMSEEEARKQFKDKGDWCKEHDRARSQCFKCDPKRYEYFAQLYHEKFQKDPPRPPESEFEK